jgi:hypothetical protein
VADGLEDCAKVCSLLAINDWDAHTLAVDVALAHAVRAGTNLWGQQNVWAGGGRKARADSQGNDIYSNWRVLRADVANKTCGHSTAKGLVTERQMCYNR